MGKLKTWTVTALLVLSLASGVWAQQVDEALFKKIEANLMCTDGCGMYLAACDNTTAQRMRQQLRERLLAGDTEQQIYAYMISIYGEEVMAAPPKTNFLNITAWVLPFLGILGGGMVIYIAVDKWVFHRQGRRAEKPDAEDAAELAAYEEILNAEMKKYF